MKHATPKKAAGRKHPRKKLPAALVLRHAVRLPEEIDNLLRGKDPKNRSAFVAAAVDALASSDDKMPEVPYLGKAQAPICCSFRAQKLRNWRRVANANVGRQYGRRSSLGAFIVAALYQAMIANRPAVQIQPRQGILRAA